MLFFYGNMIFLKSPENVGAFGNKMDLTGRFISSMFSKKHDLPSSDLQIQKAEQKRENFMKFKTLPNTKIHANRRFRARDPHGSYQPTLQNIVKRI